MTALEEMVAAAQQGDDEAFDQLVEHYQDVAYYTAHRYLGHPQQAQDGATRPSTGRPVPGMRRWPSYWWSTEPT